MTNIDVWKKRAIWLLYLPLATIVIYLWLQHATFPFVDYGLFVMLAIVVAYFPIRMPNAVFSLITGVSLAAFVIFGLVPEIFLSAVAMLGVIVRSDIKWDQHYRYPLNLLSSLTLSVVSAGAYYISLDVFGITDFDVSFFIPLGIYMLVYILINQLLIFITQKYFYGIEGDHYFNEKLVFSLKSSFLIIPLSFILIYLYYEMGTFGILLGAMPFAFVSIVTKYYYQMKNNNEVLTEVTHYSQKLASKNNRLEVINAFIDSILEIFPSERVYYFRITKGKFGILERVYDYKQPSKEPDTEIVLTDHSVVMNAMKHQTPSVYSRADEWQTRAYHNPKYLPESAVVLPVQIAGQNKGIIVVTHSHRAVYDRFSVSLISIFYQYFRIVLENVYQYEKLEDSNYIDYLTQLPNLKGFSRYIDTITQDGNIEKLSTIVMDLDHFKQVNDVHGHEGGNDVLVQVGDVLKKFTDENCFVARFGGEEFIILLRNTSKSEAHDFAETIRQAIEDQVYTINYSIETDGEAEVRTTASLGVATYPDDTDNIHDLIKLADRAMYLGSKQNGRNKVTVHYSENNG